MGLFATTARVLASNPGAFAAPVAAVVVFSWLPALLAMAGLDLLGWAGLSVLALSTTVSLLPMLHLYRVTLGCLRDGERPSANPLQAGLQLVSAGLTWGLGSVAIAVMLFPSVWAFPLVFVQAAAFDPTGGLGALAAGVAGALALAFPAIYVAVRWQFAWVLTVDRHLSAVAALSRSFALAGRHVRVLLAQAVLVWGLTGVATGLTCGFGAAPCVAVILVLQAVTYAVLTGPSHDTQSPTVR